MKELVVSKFGGSSVKDSKAMARCGKIVAQNPARKLIVISATYNTTNQLEEMYKVAHLDLGQALQLLSKNKERHFHLLQELLLGNGEGQTGVQSLNLAQLELRQSFVKACQEDLLKIYSEAEALLREVAEGPRSERLERGTFESAKEEIMAQLYGIGERLSSTIFYYYLKATFVGRKVSILDARQVIKTNSQFLRALPQVDRIRSACQDIIGGLRQSDELVVTQGFIGMDEKGRTTVLGREGSDYTATLLAQALEANWVEIWTDVAGVYGLDPRLMPSAHVLKQMDYDHATSMATLGAKVLFEQTLAPVKGLKIPVFVGSSLAPELGGTWIRNEKSVSGVIGLAIANSVRNLQSLKPMLGTKGIDLNDLETIAVVSVIGNLQENFQANTISDLLKGLGINARLLDQNALSCTWLVDKPRSEEAAQAIYSHLF